MLLTMPWFDHDQPVLVDVAVVDCDPSLAANLSSEVTHGISNSKCRRRRRRPASSALRVPRRQTVAESPPPPSDPKSAWSYSTAT